MNKLQKIYVWLVLVVAISFCTCQGLCFLTTKIQTPKPLLHRRTIIFRVDDSFTYEEQEAIAAALTRWEVASDNHFQFSFYTDRVGLGEVLRWKEDGLPTIYKASPLTSWQRHIGKIMAQSPTIVGLAMIYTGDIFIFSTNLEYELMEKIIVHEAGHIIVGPWHSPNQESIMYGRIDYPQRMIIQPEDVKIAKKFCEFFE
jgi:hypothetical protein